MLAVRRPNCMTDQRAGRCGRSRPCKPPLASRNRSVAREAVAGALGRRKTFISTMVNRGPLRTVDRQHSGVRGTVRPHAGRSAYPGRPTISRVVV